MRRNNQLTGNIGLFYVSYVLSKRGWNCLPTTRNAKGPDLVIYSQDAKRSFTVQVKALTKKSPVPFGSKPTLISDFVFIVVNVLSEKPDLFIMSSKEVKRRLHRGEKEGKVSYWLQPKQYEDFKDKWKIIDEG